MFDYIEKLSTKPSSSFKWFDIEVLNVFILFTVVLAGFFILKKNFSKAAKQF